MTAISQVTKMFKRFTRKAQEESGEVMIESTIVTIVTVMVLIFLIAIGFLIYQQVMMSDVAAEAATAIARNYKFSSDDTMITSDSYSSITIDEDYYDKIKKYRTTFNLASIKRINQTYAEEYINSRLPVTSMSYDNDLDISVQITESAVGRVYVTVTISMTPELLFDGVLSYGGMDENTQLSAYSTAECLDITGYAGLVSFEAYLATKGESELKDNINEIISNIEAVWNMIFD